MKTEHEAVMFMDSQKCRECGRSNGHKLDCGEGRKRSQVGDAHG